MGGGKEDTRGKYREVLLPSPWMRDVAVGGDP